MRRLADSCQAPVRRHRRAEVMLISGCRRGNEDALDAFVYRIADLAWREALSASGDEVAARRSAIEGLRAALSLLRGWRTPSLSVLERRVAAAAGQRQGRRWARETRVEVAAPVDLVDDLRRVARESIPELRQAAQQRFFWRLQGYAVVTAVVMGLVMVLVGYGTVRQWQAVPPSLVEGLQFRVRHAALSAALRDLSWDLPEAEGTNRRLAAALEDAALVLDEIGNLAPDDDPQKLRYLAFRISRRDLPALLVEAASIQGLETTVVMDTALALEEVSNWFAER